MASTPSFLKDFLALTPPFDRLSPRRLAQLASQMPQLRYRMGQVMIARDGLPAQVIILYEGQARSLGHSPLAATPDTLEILYPGAVLGGIGLVRGVPCETAIASTETLGLTLAATDFLELLRQEPDFAAAFSDRSHLSELYDLLGLELQRRAIGQVDLTELTHRYLRTTAALTLPQGTHRLATLDPDRLWLLSSGTTNLEPGSRLDPIANGQATLTITSPTARLVGIQSILYHPLFLSPTPVAVAATSGLSATATTETHPGAEVPNPDEPHPNGSNGSSNGRQSYQPAAPAPLAIPYAPTQPAQLAPDAPDAPRTYPLVQGKGPLDGALACFQMLSQYWQIPFRRDVLRRALSQQAQRNGQISLSFCGAIAELMGLTAQLATIPARSINRLQTPALLRWQDGFAVLYQTSDRDVVLAIPEQGIRRKSLAAFADIWGEAGEVLVLQPTKDTPQQKFGLSWFMPSVVRYRKVLFDVLIASFFVQLFGLGNPLITQIIIDKVIIQKGAETLHVLGSLLVIIAIFEALLNNIRTNLFANTTNRIDIALGTEVIDHLLRLPLRYFEKRPVGELSTRINELENIRQFLTGTALTVVLDAVFSIVYIVVMLYYSPMLTAVALATVPLFAALTLVVTPIIRRQQRTSAEHNAKTQSYLVEVVSGIQTVKAQNLELRSRWQWQKLYTRYIAAGFKTIATSTAAGSISNFLNQLSSLLLLWVGASLVLQNQITLGQLVAFRIIAGYTTSPLLRLIQLWQNFQATALSLERLSDILDTPQEADERDRQNIPMPAIRGAVKYEDVCFRFGPTGPRQLHNVTVDIPAGTFVGVVGQSGAGKSTLTKLIPRLYDLESGRILIDNYDINKVELYSLRQQIGIVLQDTLLFDTSIQENIALTNPDASLEDIIQAAKVAYAHDFIMDLPNGYSTRVGERGASLSGGQRQRIAIARTVLQNPSLLILDEATSALDYHSERQVCLNLAEAFKDRTVFFITHRLATLRPADRILMMDQGAIAEQGSHDELMNLQGLYYCLYQQQETQLVS